MHSSSFGVSNLFAASPSATTDHWECNTLLSIAKSTLSHGYQYPQTSLYIHQRAFTPAWHPGCSSLEPIECMPSTRPLPFEQHMTRVGHCWYCTTSVVAPFAFSPQNHHLIEVHLLLIGTRSRHRLAQTRIFKRTRLKILQHKARRIHELTSGLCLKTPNKTNDTIAHPFGKTNSIQFATSRTCLVCSIQIYQMQSAIPHK